MSLVPTGKVFFHRKMEGIEPDVYPADEIEVDVANKCYVVRAFGTVVAYPKATFRMEHVKTA